MNSSKQQATLLQIGSPMHSITKTECAREWRRRKKGRDGEECLCTWTVQRLRSSTKSTAWKKVTHSLHGQSRVTPYIALPLVGSVTHTKTTHSYQHTDTPHPAVALIQAPFFWNMHSWPLLCSTWRNNTSSMQEKKKKKKKPLPCVAGVHIIKKDSHSITTLHNFYMNHFIYKDQKGESYSKSILLNLGLSWPVAIEISFTFP